MTLHQVKFTPVFILIIFFSLKGFSQSDSLFSKEIIFTSKNIQYVLKVNDKKSKNYYLDTINNCLNSEEYIFRLRYYHYPYFSNYIKNGFILNQGIELCGKDSLFDFQYYTSRKNFFKNDKLIFIGENKDTVYNKCSMVDIKINAVRLALFERGYQVDLEGKMNKNLKDTLRKFAKKNGLPTHWHYNIFNYLEIDNNLLKQKFCDCINQKK